MSSDDDAKGDAPRERTEVVPPQRMIAGKYRLGRQIGEGGMGAVYEGVHVGLGARVAIKILSEQLAENPTFVRRFRREARAAAAVQHENVVAVTDTGEDDNGVPYLIMELLEGETLAATLRRERVLIPQAAAEVTAQMLKGLGAAHEKGVIHRDLKPGNIFLARQADGTYRVKVLDFGISKFAADISNLNVTVEGTIVGTPNFMAPEQVMGKHDVDARADLYAVGVMMYRMLTGKLPYAGTSSKEVYDKIIQGNPLKPHQIRPDIPAALENVVLKSMSRKASDRFQTADEYLDGLREAVPSLESGVSRPSLPGIPVPPSDPHMVAQRNSKPEDEPTSQPTRSERPALGDSMRRVTTPLAPAYDPGKDVAKAFDDTEPTPPRRQWLKAALGVGAVAAVGSGLYWAGHRNGSEGHGGGGPATGGGGDVFRYGVALYAAKEVVLASQQPFVTYLESVLGRRVEISLVEDYMDIGLQVETGKLDLAALPAYVYVRATESTHRPKLLARAVTTNGIEYESAIVVRRDSDIHSLADLKDKVFCYVSPTSTSGFLYPRAMFRRAGMDPDRSFQATRFVGDHLGAIRALHEKACDGAAMYYAMVGDQAQHGLDPGEFRVLLTTEKIPYDAYCVPGATDDATAAKWKSLLLGWKPAATAKPAGVSGALIGFIPATDSDYDGVRNIVVFLDHAEHKGR